MVVFDGLNDHSLVPLLLPNLMVAWWSSQLSSVNMLAVVREGLDVLSVKMVVLLALTVLFVLHSASISSLILLMSSFLFPYNHFGSFDIFVLTASYSLLLHLIALSPSPVCSSSSFLDRIKLEQSWILHDHFFVASKGWNHPIIWTPVLASGIGSVLDPCFYTTDTAGTSHRSSSCPAQH